MGSSREVGEIRRTTKRWKCGKQTEEEEEEKGKRKRERARQEETRRFKLYKLVILNDVTIQSSQFCLYSVKSQQSCLKMLYT